MMRTVGPPPDAAVDAARRALDAVNGGLVDNVSAAGLVVANALVTGSLDDQHVRAIVGHGFDDDTVNAWLFGGPAAREWADFSTLPVHVAAVRERGNLRALSARLNAIEARFRDRVETAVSQAMRHAVGHALRKADVRVQTRLSAAKLAAVRDDWMNRRISPAVCAALATTDHDLLRDQFDSLGAHLGALFAVRNRQRRQAIRQQFPDVEFSDWDMVEEQRGLTLRDFAITAMFSAGGAILAAGGPTAPTRGELPADLFAPGDIVRGIERIANGSPVAPDGEVVVSDGTAAPRSWDYTDQLVTDALAAMSSTGELLVSYTWMGGEPDRPFEPHQVLAEAGATFTDETWEIVCANDDPSGWPADTLLPGDHDGCQCWLDPSYADGSEAPGGE